MIESLAVMGHGPALDLCVQALRWHPDYACFLRAHLIKLDSETALDMGVSYFVEGFGSADELRRTMTSNCADCFQSVYSKVNPPYVVELIGRTLAASPAAGRMLAATILRACNLSQLAPLLVPQLAAGGTPAQIRELVQEFLDVGPAPGG